MRPDIVTRLKMLAAADPGDVVVMPRSDLRTLLALFDGLADRWLDEASIRVRLEAELGMAVTRCDDLAGQVDALAARVSLLATAILVADADGAVIAELARREAAA